MDQFLYIQMVILMLVIFVPSDTSSMSAEEKTELRKQVLSMFNHGYRSYMDFAYPADELMPLSCKGRYRGVEKSRGDVDDILGNYSLTLIDTLDTLVVLGELEEFDRAVRLVINGVNFDTDIVVSVFEANIRVLGGLLGGHVMAKYLKSRRKGMDWYRDELLEKAKDIGQRLLPAFNTSTGMPYPRVNLRYGVKHVMSRTGSEKDTCTACAGTMILEFSALSRLSGDPIFEEKAHKAMSYLWQSRHRSTDLVGTVINIHNGDWVRRDSGVGAGIDSYYEYLLKAYILLGDETYLNRFNKHYAAVRKYVTQGPLLVDVHMHKPLTNSRNFMDALLAFWPGLQVLIGDMKPAIETHEMLYQVMQRHNFLPEAFTTDFRIHWAHHPLRPEFLESTYFLHKATGDPHYLEVGKEVLNNLNTHARVKCGYAALRDVTTGAHEDQMDSYVLAETFKYLYLLFSEPDDLVLDIEQFVFTTEAHLLPLSLSTHNNTQNGTKMVEIDPLFDTEDENYERTCPNTNHVYQGDYVKTFREPLKNMVGSSCPVSHSSRRPRLKAADFLAGDKAQMDELKRMGITIITMKDGRVQLLHTAADAQSTDSAEDGMNFMQEMIELSKNQQTQGNDAQHEACVVQYMVPPYLGTVMLSAGPAQFGHDLKKHGQVRGEVIVADPLTACSTLHNEIDVYGKIVVTRRGDCMFVDKARQIQASGAIGGIVIDSHEGTTSGSQPLFAMSGDGTDNILIPMVFVFHAEGQRLLEALDNYSQQFVFLTATEKKAEDVMSELLSIPEQKAWIEEHSSSTFESTDDILDTDTAGGPVHRTNTFNLNGMQVKVRTTRPEDNPGETPDPTTGESTTPSLDSLVANFVAELTRHTNFESLRKTNAYLVAIKQMMAAIASSNYQLMDSNSLAFLEELTKELKPKVKDATVAESADGDMSEPVDQPDQQITAFGDVIVSKLDDEIDNVIIQELQRVVDEAAGLVSPASSRSAKHDDAARGADMKEGSRPYATAEELMGHIPEDGVYEKSGERYLPPNVEQAPDWMTLESGEVIMADGGRVYADLTQSYWDWARDAINELLDVPSNAGPPAVDGGPSTSKLPALSQKSKDLGPRDPAETSAQVPQATVSSHSSDSSPVDQSSSPPRSVRDTSHRDTSHLEHNNELSENERTREESDESDKIKSEL